MKIKQRIQIIATCLFAIFGCQTVQSEDDARGLETKKANSRLGTAIWLQTECPSKRADESALLAPLVAIGAEFLVNMLGSAIEGRTEGLSGQFIARGTTSDGLSNKGCLIVGRGRFGSPYSGSIKSGIKPDDLEQLGFSDYPAFYVELGISLQVNKAEKTETVSLSPVFVAYGQTSAKNQRKKEKEVSLVIAFSRSTLKDKDAIEGKAPFAVFRHSLGQLEVGKSYDSTLLAGTSASQGAKEASFTAGSSVTALVTESEDPSLALKVFTEAFKNKKSDLQSALEKVIGKMVGVEEDEDSDEKDGKGAKETK